MQAGETVDYEGAAVRASDGSAVEVKGTFLVQDQVEHDGAKHWPLQDVRLDEFPPEHDPLLHTYLVPLDTQPTTG